MFEQPLRRIGDEYVVTIPDEEVERLQMVEGQMLGIVITPIPSAPRLRTWLKEALDDSWEVNQEGYRYLADR